MLSGLRPISRTNSGAVTATAQATQRQRGEASFPSGRSSKESGIAMPMLIGQAYCQTVRSRRTSQVGAPRSSRISANGPAAAVRLWHSPPTM